MSYQCSDHNWTKNEPCESCLLAIRCKRIESLEAELSAERRAREGAEIALRAWQKAFGTSQLTHAVARLESETRAREDAERKLARLEEWATQPDRMPANSVFSNGPELRIAYLIEAAEYVRMSVEIDNNALAAQVESLKGALAWFLDRPGKRLQCAHSPKNIPTCAWCYVSGVLTLTPAAALAEHDKRVRKEAFEEAERLRKRLDWIDLGMREQISLGMPVCDTLFEAVTTKLDAPSAAAERAKGGA